jgi:hypothetical protein
MYSNNDRTNDKINNQTMKKKMEAKITKAAARIISSTIVLSTITSPTIQQ